MPILVTDPAHGVAPHAVRRLLLDLAVGVEGEGVPGENLPPVDAPDGLINY